MNELPKTIKPGETLEVWQRARVMLLAAVGVSLLGLVLLPDNSLQSDYKRFNKYVSWSD